MNDDELIRAVKESVTNAHMTIPAEQIISRSRVIHARRRISCLTGSLAVIAAAAIAVTTLPGHGTNSATTFTVKLLADRAAAAALSRPAIRPGQWVYREIKYQIGLDYKRTGAEWTTAAGKLSLVQVKGSRNMLFIMAATPYSKLGSLPSDPAALEKYLGDQPFHWPSVSVPAGRPPTTPSEHATRAFNQITGMLWDYVLPPKLAAELFRALADIPGIKVRRDATDIAGQHGVAFVLPHAEVPARGLSRNPLAMRLELILNPHNYRLMALATTDAGAIHGRTYRAQLAIIRQAFVPRPGVRP